MSGKVEISDKDYLKAARLVSGEVFNVEEFDIDNQEYFVCMFTRTGSIILMDGDTKESLKLHLKYKKLIKRSSMFRFNMIKGDNDTPKVLKSITKEQYEFFLLKFHKLQLKEMLK